MATVTQTLSLSLSSNDLKAKRQSHFLVTPVQAQSDDELDTLTFDTNSFKLARISNLSIRQLTVAATIIGFANLLGGQFSLFSTLAQSQSDRLYTTFYPIFNIKISNSTHLHGGLRSFELPQILITPQNVLLIQIPATDSDATPTANFVIDIELDILKY